MRRRNGARLAIVVLGALSIGWNTAPPHDYGTVVLDTRSSEAGMPPVAFQHWQHRAAYTCRVCHVDVGFAMARGETRISASNNRAGQYCGACHDGRRQHRGRTVFASCSDARDVRAGKHCSRCHARRDDAARRAAYDWTTRGLPRLRSGHVDWERAEAERLLQPSDVVEGLSIERPRLRMNKDVAIASRGTWMANILFSHRKHAVWNGCELCHPEIFPSTKTGNTKYSMFQISSGEYCGVCHDKVAFPLGDCERCHTAPVR